jgi:hypothetical protein
VALVAEIGLAEKLVRVHETLDTAAIPHAFGGAIALAYYAEPRATIDIDVNLFIPPAQYRDVLVALRPLGIVRAPTDGEVLRDGQGRVWWDRTPIDLFFSYDGVHDAMRDRVRVVPFGSDRIPVLAPEHLLVAKVVFDRSKDWVDIEQMLLAVPSLDLAEAERWLEHLVGNDDQRVQRLHALVEEMRGA